MLPRAALDWECWDCAEVGEALALASKPGEFCILTARYFAESDGLALCADALRLPNCRGAVLFTSEPLRVVTVRRIRVLVKPYTTRQLTDCLETLLDVRPALELAAHSMQRPKALVRQPESGVVPANGTAGRALKRQKSGR